MSYSPLAPLTDWLEKGLRRQVRATGLGIFRIGYGLVALQEIAFLYFFRHLIFDETPYLDPGPPLISLFLLLWGTVALGLTLGLRTRLCAAVNYLFWVLFTSFTPMWRDFDGGFDQLMISSGLLLVFLPSWRALSLDNLRLKLQSSTLGQRFEPPRTVPILAYYLPLLISLGLLYFDSAIHKLFAEHWRNGMGAWLPSSHPYYVSPLSMRWLLELEWLQRAITYTIIGFQFLFPFLFWHRRFRVPLLILGTLFHGGITLSFNIYPFGLGMLIHYALLVPFGWWRRIGESWRSTEPRLTVFYDGQCPLCWRTVLAVEHFDLRRSVVFRDLQTHAAQEPALADIDPSELLADLYAVDSEGRRYRGIDTYLAILKAMGYLRPLAWVLRLPGIYSLAAHIYRRIADSRQRLTCDAACLPASGKESPLRNNWEAWLGSSRRQAFRLSRMLVVLLLLQLNSTLHYGLLYRFGLADRLGPLGPLSNMLVSVSHAFLGITPHALYLDDHFKGYEQIFAITYLDRDGKEHWLPFVNREGRLISPNWGRVHSMWANIAVTPRLDKRRLEKFLEKVTAFYGLRLGFDLDDARFRLKAKPIRMPADWEPELRRWNLSQPWRDVGEIIWRDQVMEMTLREALPTRIKYSDPR
ncbi:MAG: DCC1-like thiol-disulfide oxidoreductase family protein [Methylohalobius sp. ZOD2]